jgi:hypothetical protein
MMTNESRLEKIYSHIHSAGHRYASELYSDGFAWILEDATPTKKDVYDNFDESAHHEGIQASLFENEKSEYFKYLDLIDYDLIVYYFCAGGHRLIDENFRDT